MLNKILFFLTFFILTDAFSLEVETSAPSFSLIDQKGEMRSLKSFRGKYVILEWYNYDCPFVKKHYDSGNMQMIQRLYAENDQVVWLSIVSSAKGKQGFLASPKKAQERMKLANSSADHVLLDFDGKVGNSYGAKTTPHIYIIDHKGVLKYNGAIDSISSFDKSDIKKARNYITSSMSKVMLNEKPHPAKTKPYGCSVKY